ncbi:MAG: hypothetical protein RR362_01735 [Raoultibacter sp.]
MVEKKNKPIPIGDDGVPMTIWQIWLKRLCMVMVVWAVLGLLLGVGLILFAQFADLSGIKGFEGNINTSEDAQSLLFFMGVASIVGAFVNVVSGFLGLRGAKNPKKIALFFWIALIDAVLTAWSLIGGISQGVVDVTALISGAVILVLALCAWQVRGQTGYFDKHPMPEEEE